MSMAQDRADGLEACGMKGGGESIRRAEGARGFAAPVAGETGTPKGAGMLILGRHGNSPTPSASGSVRAGTEAPCSSLAGTPPPLERNWFAF